MYYVRISNKNKTIFPRCVVIHFSCLYSFLIFNKHLTVSFIVLLFCQVLCGEMTQGAHGMRAPPVKVQPAILYDAVADNPNTPTIVVIFSDTQAYPEYLITFQ